MVYGSFLGSLCLSDIDKSLIKTGKNGKKYLDIYIGERKDMGKYGETHFIRVAAKRDENNNPIQQPACYIGSARPAFEKKPVQADVQQVPKEVNPDDDFPF